MKGIVAMEVIHWWPFFRRQLHGERRPQPPGRAVNACCNFAIADLNSPKGMPRLREPARSQLWRMVRSLARFSSSSHIVFRLPSKSKPKSILRSEYCPSPFSNFRFGDRVIAVNYIGREYIVDARHYSCCNVLQLFSGSGDEDTHEIVGINFEGIKETHIC